MRRVIFTDKVWSPEGFPEVKVHYGALTEKQHRQAEAIKERFYADQIAEHGLDKIGNILAVSCVEYIEFICRHGIRKVQGLELERSGKVMDLTIEPIDGIYGKYVSDEEWEEFLPFFEGPVRQVLALDILGLSQISSSKKAPSPSRKSRRSKA